MAKSNLLVDTTRPFVAKLLNDLSNRALIHYEQQTGLQGIKETFSPLVGNMIVSNIGNATFGDEEMMLGGKIFEWLSGLGKVGSRIEGQQEQQPLPQQQPQAPIFQQQLPKPRSMPVKGAPMPGAFNQSYGRRKGRE